MGSGVEIMTWYTSVLQRDGLLPATIWGLVRWIAFFFVSAQLFKLASLSFAVPVFCLIVFDFCLWIWRLTRPVPAPTRLQPSLAQSSEQKHSPPFAISTGSSNEQIMGHSQTFAGLKRAGFPATSDA
ncbi:hypothetical protein PG993_005261 [Apiospora rasikravindrae]|uniref:Uncharacterized protein n=1 Tax=Apiospora rasikravindrae TaxID=990691 RepID=A0ABR1TF65_9PEZI